MTMTRASSRLPFMSVVVNTYNGAGTIARTLDSLLAQDYPADRREIIVVDDGSTDNTSHIVAQYPAVRCIVLAHNVGISEARNAGLAAAKGDVYAAFDDDCIASPDWLRQLAKGYSFPDVIGVGGYLVDESEAGGVPKKYRDATGSGFAPRATATDKRSFMRRLQAYVMAGLRRFESSDEEWTEVTELYGANSSFPIAALREVGGWRADMTGIEDRDVCLRIRKCYPNKHFYAIRDAKIIHDPMMSLTQYLLRPYRRGLANFRFHYVNKITPPLFPFPLLMLGAVGIAVAVNRFAVPGVLLLAPQLLYFWWPYYAARHRKPTYLLFPYLQLAEEAMVLVGLLRGYVSHVKEAYGDR
ncbi:MAG TPA: glycosyltransferase family 2 protein [Candidatus Saccharimonadales bacterium]|nr:glycosyltransferase family 2 protein [Candidatus Saccharimonadales bacterium]